MSPATEPQLTAIVGATLVSTDGGPTIPDALVLIDGTRFLWVGRREQRDIPPLATVLDASGRWMIPGLFEGHCHVSGFASPAYHPGLGLYAAAPPVLEAMAQHGITTVRDTGGPDLESMELLHDHDEAWPRFFGSGPNLDGFPGGPWKGIWKTDDPDEVAEFVRREHAGGVDFIKLYAWMTAPVMRAAVDEAHHLGLRVAAHVGWAVTASQAVEIGVDALEHVRIGRELIGPAEIEAIGALPEGFHHELASGAPWRYADPDGPAATQVIDLLLERHVYLTPTLVVHHRSAFPVRLAPPAEGDGSLGAALAAHADGAHPVVEYDAVEAAARALEFERIGRFVARAHEAGVPIVAGSDAPGPDIPPGSSLHHELRLLVTAGLSPREALRAATVTPAGLLGQTGRLGTIRPGAAADFVLLRADPLAAITNTTAIDATWRDGQPLVTV
jgi:imidazolonepropionase-like amidohydrolase